MITTADYIIAIFCSFVFMQILGIDGGLKYIFTFFCDLLYFSIIKKIRI